MDGLLLHSSHDVLQSFEFSALNYRAVFVQNAKSTVDQETIQSAFFRSSFHLYCLSFVELKCTLYTLVLLKTCRIYLDMLARWLFHRKQNIYSHISKKVPLFVQSLSCVYFIQISSSVVPCYTSPAVEIIGGAARQLLSSSRALLK